MSVGNIFHPINWTMDHMKIGSKKMWMYCMCVCVWIYSILLWYDEMRCDAVVVVVVAIIVVVVVVVVILSFFPNWVFACFNIILSTIPSFIHIAWLYFHILLSHQQFPLQSYTLLILYCRKSGKQIKFANRMLFFSLFSTPNSLFITEREQHICWMEKMIASRNEWESSREFFVSGLSHTTNGIFWICRAQV